MNFGKMIWGKIEFSKIGLEIWKSVDRIEIVVLLGDENGEVFGDLERSKNARESSGGGLRTPSGLRLR